MIALFDFEKGEILEDIIWTYLRTENRQMNRVGECQDELRQANPLFLVIPPTQARPRYNRRAQPLRVITQLESDST